MSQDTKAMEEALQLAVARMSKQDGNGNGAANPMSMLAAILPKLLANDVDREDLVEKLEGLEKDSLGPLQEHVIGLRKQVQRVAKTQATILEELAALREQQTAIGNAVLHLAQQMARVGIIDDDEGEEEFEAPRPTRAPTKKRRG